MTGTSYGIRRSEEYCVTSGWDPGRQCDVVENLAWHEIDVRTQDALIGLVVRAHGYARSQAEKHFAGSGTDDEATVMLIRHKHNTQTNPPPPPLSSSSSHGRAARGGGRGGLRRNHNGVARPRRQRDTTSRYTAATLRHLESAFRDDGVL